MVWGFVGGEVAARLQQGGKQIWEHSRNHTALSIPSSFSPDLLMM